MTTMESWQQFNGATKVVMVMMKETWSLLMKMAVREG